MSWSQHAFLHPVYHTFLSQDHARHFACVRARTLTLSVALTLRTKVAVGQDFKAWIYFEDPNRDGTDACVSCDTVQMVHIFAHARARTHIHTHTHTYTHIHTHTHTYTHIYTHTHTHTRAHAHNAMCKNTTHVCTPQHS